LSLRQLVDSIDDPNDRLVEVIKYMLENDKIKYNTEKLLVLIDDK